MAPVNPTRSSGNLTNPFYPIGESVLKPGKVVPYKVDRVIFTNGTRFTQFVDFKDVDTDEVITTYQVPPKGQPPLELKDFRATRGGFFEKLSSDTFYPLSVAVAVENALPIDLQVWAGL